MSRLRSLIDEIHRRSLWQVLSIYLAGSWVALQVVEQLAEAAGLPSWVRPLALVLLVIGLPIVMATAFVQEGMTTKAPEAPSQSLADVGEVAPPPREPTTGAASLFTWRNALAGGVIAFALLGLAGTGWVLFGGGSLSPAMGGGDVNPHSIAVLPFASVDEENEAFRVGVHDALLTQLAKVRDLQVISRTSMLEYEGTRKPIPRIGEELRVARVLEGSVQRADDVVQINVQLIDAATDNHLWAESYTRDLSASNLIAIQSEIVRDIARELRAVLAPEEEARIASVPTHDLEAYDLFLRARDLQQREGRGSRMEAVEVLEQAVTLDPDFALAWAYLSMGHSGAYWYGYDRTQTRIQRARAAVDRAFELDPGLPEASLALGTYYYRTQRDYEAALRELTAAREEMGETADLVGLIGAVERRQGDFASAAANMRRAAELDPRGSIWGWTEGQTLWMVGDFAGADRAIDRTLNLAPGHPAAWDAKIRTHLFATGDLAGARRLLDSALATGSTLAVSGYRLALLERDGAAALETLGGLPELVPLQYGAVPRAYYEAVAHALDGETARARQLLDSARVIFEGFVRTQPGNETARLNLALTYARLGRAEDALDAAGAALELLPDDEFLTASFLRTIASVHAAAGASAEAIDLLRTLATDRPITLLLLGLDPVWDPLRDEPGFEALVERERAAWAAGS
ncbi:MAG: tetratricopeptide repeat protein [Gemmatimonadota bacterium]|nr:tetratricopeptide repeat protein [Gemmatimonadota bacterium]